jgi:large subunit ribosomal protein L18
MSSVNSKKEARHKRKTRIRKKISGTASRPRLSIFRSARHIYAQVIDDSTGLTMAAASTTEKPVKDRPSFENKVDAAGYVGKLVAERVLEKGIKQVVFDRNGFLYHGRVKAVSEGARKAGLEF